MSTATVNTQPRLHTARVRGWQSPFSRDQLVATALYPILSSDSFRLGLCIMSVVLQVFYLQGVFYLPQDQQLTVFIIYSVLLVTSVSCWVYVESVDPSKPGGIRCLCMKYTQSNSRYCASCHKTVPGLDHHCLWLNTCIGTRNYFFFFTLAVAGTLQFTFQTLICLMLLTYWHPSRQRVNETLHNLITYQVLTILHAVAGVLALLSFGSLCCFHLYLQALGLGTYDWILSARTRNTGPSTTTVVAAPPSPPKTRRPEIELPKVANAGVNNVNNKVKAAAMVSPAGNSPESSREGYTSSTNMNGSSSSSTSGHVAVTVQDHQPAPGTASSGPGDIESANP